MPDYTILKEGRVVRRVSCSENRIADQVQEGETYVEGRLADSGRTATVERRLVGPPTPTRCLSKLVETLRDQGIDLSEYDRWLQGHFTPPPKR